MAPKRILVADDEGDIVELVAYNLEGEGFSVLKAHDGRKAWEMVRMEKPDLVILDLMMPELDGFSVLDQLKARPETAHIPVIVASAKELTPEEKNRLKGQIQALMQKGDFLNDEFLEEVRALLK